MGTTIIGLFILAVLAYFIKKKTNHSLFYWITKLYGKESCSGKK
ncbi:hypothetical protein N9R79_03445 [Vibrio sp.]|nr:hypothetical protein [Vibrio sp.]